MGQELVTVLIVLAAVAYLASSVWKKYGAEALAHFFLKHGKVRIAMRLKRQSRPGCSDCV